MVEHLKQNREDIPIWLKNYQPGCVPDFKDLNESRCAYYPGAGDDGCLVKTCNQAHCCHLYILADYLYTWDNSFYKMETLSQCRGYDIIGSHDLGNLLCTFDDVSHIEKSRLWRGNPNNSHCFGGCYTPKFVLNIYQRRQGYGDEYGADRFAVLLCRYDAIALYDLFFGNKVFKNLFIMLVQEHGLGGNYGMYSREMLEIARNADVLPNYIIMEKHYGEWTEYREVPNTEPVIGGMHKNIRYLFKKGTISIY